MRKLATENYEMLFHFVCLVLEKYFDYCYPSLKNSTQQIAADLIETRPSWKAEDFINLCKYFRQNPTETYGQLTPEKFMLRISDYEEQRAQAMEQYRREQRGNHDEANKELNPLAEKLALKMIEKGNVVTGDKKLGRQMDAQREKSERNGYGKLATKPQNHQEFFEPKKV